MTDLTKLTAKELYARTWLHPVSDEHAEIRRRLMKLEEIERAQGRIADKEKA